jgi:3-hydroxymyristoyl/3-hydroxydecanoyl-(acyl carrier protein) dehydratase
MKSVADILKGKQTFADMATAVKKNVYYVNAGSYADLAHGLEGLIDEESHLVALTYRGDLPYFISDTKRYLERLAVRLSKQGKSTLIAALPEAWTQSSQFFTGIELAVIGNYLDELKDATSVSEDLSEAFNRMEQQLNETEGAGETISGLQSFLHEKWDRLRCTEDSGELYSAVEELFSRMRKEGTFSTLRRAVAVISEYVREACGVILVRDLMSAGKYNSGDVRQIFFKDLTGLSSIEAVSPRPILKKSSEPAKSWITYEKDDVRNTLSMYGQSFLFVDRVVMERGELHEGSVGFAAFTVPTPDENRIMGDHFVDMPIFGGHLQMEAVAQFGTFMILKALNDPRLVPILTGTEFPDLNTMAPPGEKLSMMGIIHMHDKRNLTLEAFIENRFARSKGQIKGMILNSRLVKKMLVSFSIPNGDD